ncbi:MAG TPA: hypothetical protein VFB12_33010 [Ktedonobacteraceae bacterium]|nr:hypothetical protein [Ktedonobacteraceae bacterium]
MPVQPIVACIYLISDIAKKVDKCYSKAQEQKQGMLYSSLRRGSLLWQDRVHLLWLCRLTSITYTWHYQNYRLFPLDYSLAKGDGDEGICCKEYADVVVDTGYLFI